MVSSYSYAGTAAACGGTAAADDSNYLSLVYLLGAPASCLTTTTVNVSASVSPIFLNPPLTGSQSAVDNCNGKWTITISTQVAASYSLWITLGNNHVSSGGQPTQVNSLWSGGVSSYSTVPAQPMQICQTILPNGNIVSGISTQFTITPLIAYGPNSLLADGILSPCSQGLTAACLAGYQNAGGVAGVATYFDLILRDIYFNYALASAVNIQIGTVGSNPCGGNPLSVSANATNTGGGSYRLPFTENVAGNYTLLVYVSGSKVGAASTCPTFTIMPNYVFYFSVCPPSPVPAISLPMDLYSGGRCELNSSNPAFGGVSGTNALSWAIQSNNIVAGIPNSFSINSADQYGNQVLTDASQHYFIATFTLTNVYVNRAAVSYSFSVNSVLVNGAHVIYYQLAWAGTYQVQVQLVADPAAASLPVYQNTKSYYFLIQATPSTCLAATGVNGYRCPDNSCASSYSSCSAFSSGSLCTSTNSLLCPGAGACSSSCSNSCVDPQCAIPGTCNHCPNDGQCAFSGSCPIVSTSGGCPASAPLVCPTTGQCVAQLSDCRSQRACPYPLIMCDDMRTCVSNVATCPAVRQCAPGTYLCPGNVCVSSQFDCPTAVSCLTSHNGTSAPNQVVCSDGSCQPDPSFCPNQYSCYNGMVRCWDGSCRFSQSDCPSEVTCYPGQIRCEDGSCKSDLSFCNTPLYCPLGTVRCPEGDCVPNIMLCGTRTSCLSGMIKCPDGSCNLHSWQCSAAPNCIGGNSSFTCPGGSCASSYANCPTIPTCPPATPVRCASGDCAVSLVACLSSSNSGMSQRCPPYAPIHCEDNSCVGSLAMCPTLTTCPANAPVRCPDRRCVAAVSMCVSAAAIACPQNRVRCPSGECAVSFSACPTPIVCSNGETRCQDGTCRYSCSGSANHNGVILTDCFNGQVWCPQAAQGTFCANSFAQCPPQLTCPPEKPIRCMDHQCQSSLSDCTDPATSLSTATNYYACMGGSFAQQPNLCPTSTVCVGTFSVKCWDETCRASAADCPPNPGCPPTAPFLCPSGACSTDIFQCTMGVRCNPVSNTPIKCPVYAGSKTCVASLNNCIDPTNITLWKSTFTDPNTLYDYANSGSVNLCPDGGTRCQDGSCRLSGGSSCVTGVCPFTPTVCITKAVSTTAKISVYCPAHLSFLCPSGQCAMNSSMCETSSMCPVHLPVRCSASTTNFGLCVSDVSQCGATQPISAACSNPLQLPCPAAGGGTIIPFCVTCSQADANGFCATSGLCPTNSTGCPAGFTMCHDKQCVDGINSFCTKAANDYVNACPINRPYRCDGQSFLTISDRIISLLVFLLLFIIIHLNVFCSSILNMKIIYNIAICLCC